MASRMVTLSHGTQRYHSECEHSWLRRLGDPLPCHTALSFIILNNKQNKHSLYFLLSWVTLSKGGLPAGLEISMIRLQVLLLYYINSTSNPSKNAGGPVDWLFCIKFWIEHVTVPMSHLDLVLCDRPVRDSRYLAVPQLGFKSLLLHELLPYWVEFITRLHHLVGIITILQKSAVFCIMPIGVHTPLPQYPPGVWQFSISPLPRCIIIMCLSKHKYLFHATWWVSFCCCYIA